MSAYAPTQVDGLAGGQPRIGIGVTRLALAYVWLTIALSGVVFSEPALCDALMQDADHAGPVHDGVLMPLAQGAAEMRETLAAKAAATKVEFFTLARQRS